MIAVATTPLIADAHNDLLLELEQRRFEKSPFERYWLPNLERGGVGLQVCPVFGSELEALPELILRRNLLQVAAFQRAVRENSERVVAVGSKADLDPVERRERIGLMLSMEGAEALGYETTLIDVFYELGLRMVSLTWNRRNPFADGAAEPDGGGPLSNLGRELVDRIAGLGIILDLVHASERTFWEAIERTTGPVCVSHAACRMLLQWRADESTHGQSVPSSVGSQRPPPLPVSPEDLLLSQTGEVACAYWRTIGAHPDCPDYASWRSVPAYQPKGWTPARNL